MSIITTRKFVFWSVVALVFLAMPVALTTCDSPMGMGPPIDWEPPILTLDGASVRYVRNDTKLTGTVIDNGKVDRVILRDTVTDTVLFKATLLPDDLWEIVLEFDESRNGDKILGQLIAYDTFGNTGDMSVASITLHVDTGDPFVEDIWIQRTESREAYLYPFRDLKDLERTDPQGESPAQINMYQNGVFWVNARISELETRIDEETLKVHIYDERYPDTPIFPDGIARTDGTVYNPRFLLDEKEILAFGERAFGAGYTARYDSGERFYYRLNIEAQDKAENVNMVNEQDYFCMWKTADVPKGIIDPSAGLQGTISLPKGSTIPLVFYDDDTLEYAFVALFTRNQWDGDADINIGDRFPAGTNEAKLNFIKNRFLAGTPTYDWNYEKHNLAAKLIENLVPLDKTMDEKYWDVQLGNTDHDYGEYKLITVVKDKKLKPHGDTPHSYPDITTVRIWDVNVIDENAPLIVFDKTNKCPEENTFPTLTDGIYFDIVGYTLRENNTGEVGPVTVPNIGNRVTYFRMAWIPYGMPGGADDYVAAVRAAMEKRNPTNADFPAGVQWWTLRDEGQSINLMTKDENEKVSTGVYRKQSFVKRFDVTYGTDNLKPEYQNFTYNGYQENETKLFLFYAEDNMGHIAHSQLYLLGQKSLPSIEVYDLTANFTKRGVKTAPPNIRDYIYLSTDGTITNTVREAYQAALDSYNRQLTTYNTISNGVAGITQSVLDELVMAGLQPYPRSTYTTYWVTASGNNAIKLREIKMEDVTTTVTSRGNIGYSNLAGDGSTGNLSYTEFHPEVTSKTFRFTATDNLGNANFVQRTVMVTNAALLTEITTKTQDGEYGIGTKIVLEARFSAMVSYTGTPMLNVRYQRDGSTYTESIPVDDNPLTGTPPGTPTLYLAFPLTVDVGYGGRLETLYDGATGGNSLAETNRPLKLNGATTIIDSARGDNAFLPGYSEGFVWADDTGSLQKSRNILLNGTRPQSDGYIAVSGKTAYEAGEWYFKAGETMEFTLSSVNTLTNNLILPGEGGNPRIRFRVGTSTTDYFANWQRSAGNGQQMVFSVSTDAIPAGTEGTIGSLALNTDQGTIVNGVGNKLVYYGTNDLLEMRALTLRATKVVIDKTPPLAPTSVTVGGNTPITTGTNNYNGNPVLAISTTAPTNEQDPFGIANTQYSLNNGLKWVDYRDKDGNPNAEPGWTGVLSDNLTINGGEWILRTRHIDRAGNEGAATSHTLSVNSTFPQLRSITADKPNGRYTGGDLNFTLSFSAPVWRSTPGNLTITLTNRSASNANVPGTDAVNPTYERVLTATTVANSAATATTSVSFAWTGITGKEMLDGLYISSVDFTALRDIYTNPGFAGTAANTSPYLLTINNSGSTTYTCNNLSAGLIVDCLAPTLSSMTPANANSGVTAASVMSPTNGNTNDANYNRIIRLIFSEAVQAGSGTITVKPHGAYFIPPVFENDSHYLEVRTGNRSSTVRSGYTKIVGFYDIYNALPSTGTPNRTNLAAGPSMTDPTKDARTGQTAGPYIKMTQGLKEGRGYSGNYTLTGTPLSGPNVDRNNTYMVPDTATKWVLDYRYSINNQQNTQIVASTGGDLTLSGGGQNDAVVTAIRAALTAAKYRWQEIDVTASSVTYSADRKTVTITLPEPLENGLQWDICYPAGTFTDLAGHNAPSINYNGATILGENGTYWFVSNGVQTPVIRVNRKSFDARTGNWATIYPAAGSQNPSDAQFYNVPSNRDAPGGWGIGDFNTVHYRIETETPNAALYSRTVVGALANNGSVNIAAAGANWTTVPGATGTVNWYETGTTNGTMVRPNLVRRSSTGTNNNAWSVTDENGIASNRSFAGTHRGFRSYNKDALLSELSGGTLTQLTTTQAPNNGPVSSGTVLNFTYLPTEASKNYVVAEARVTYGATVTASVKRGYEGVFRSVVAILSNNTQNPLFVEGSNVKNGMPSIAGFPVQDAAESGDNRYIKYFYNAGANAGGNTDTRFYWVSTEIVSDWYFIKFGNNSRHMNSGEVNNYLTAGYGDLTFAYRPE